MRYRITAALLVFILLPICKSLAQVSLDLEGGYVVSIPYNVVRIPAVGGTKFDLAQDLDPNTTFTFRARVNFLIGQRHVISGLYAPLTIRSSGTINRAIEYSGETFAANTNLKAEYKFNSYRLTYRYILISQEKFQFGLGLTGKIREANITLTNEDTKADYPDLGFVPLINFYLKYSASERWHILFEGDALGTSKGRAEDVFAGASYDVSKNIHIKAGYRLLEGGADVSRNYNFTLVNYAAVGVMIDFAND